MKKNIKANMLKFQLNAESPDHEKLNVKRCREKMSLTHSTPHEFVTKKSSIIKQSENKCDGDRTEESF